ncbi:IS66 family insertion sequence element accessory protein TnpA [Robinsoniella peoriensis]|uniref:IS66 family insertion sequence element accessory protein TnpA n=1 Tax=Robinsoniella peoriensis TaxID=180332 RepID=UPI0005C7C932|nr:helix-turn-helix domain-containing protein [Robinsoniella peoriensis]
MRSTRIPAHEQYLLIMECRSSGLTDHQWCVEHDIKPGTFYNWVKRLRQKGCSDLPPATGRSCNAPEKQEVVKVDFKNQASCSQNDLMLDTSCTRVSVPDIPSINLSIGRCTLSIPNGTDPLLLAQVFNVLKEFEC